MSPLTKHFQNDKDTKVENQLKVRQSTVRHGGRRGASTKGSHHRYLCHDGFSMSPDVMVIKHIYMCDKVYSTGHIIAMSIS